MQTAFYLHNDPTDGLFVVEQPEGGKAKILAGPFGDSSSVAKARMEKLALKHSPQAQFTVLPNWADGEDSDEGYPLTPAFKASWVIYSND